MIRFDYTTLLDQLHPTLSPREKELRYQHPSGLIWCNQLGMLYPTNEDHTIQYMNKGTVSVKTEDGLLRLSIKERVVYECYHGIQDSRGIVHHDNLNLLDFTKENLLVYKSKSVQSQDYHIRYRLLENATIKYMNEKSLELYQKNLDPEYYWELIQPGEALVKKWRLYFERYLSLYLPHEQGKSIPY
jgi:hypothetical protein